MRKYLGNYQAKAESLKIPLKLQENNAKKNKKT